MVNIDTIQKNYPLHWLVWNNNYVELEEELSTKLVGKKKKKEIRKKEEKKRKMLITK